MEIKLLVIVQVDTDGKDLDERDLRNTAQEAVYNAVKMGEDAGFTHKLANEVSVGMVAVDLVEE